MRRARFSRVPGTSTDRFVISAALTGYGRSGSETAAKIAGSAAACRAVATPMPAGPGIGIPYAGSKRWASPPEIRAGIHGRSVPSAAEPVASITPSSPACRSSSRNIQARWAALARPASRISPGRNHRVPGLATVGTIGGSLTIASERTVQSKRFRAISTSSIASPRAESTMSASHRWSRSAGMSFAASNTLLASDSAVTPARRSAGSVSTSGSSVQASTAALPSIATAWLHWLSRSKTWAKAEASS